MESIVKPITFPTWEEVRSVDDLVLEAEKTIIIDIETELEARCPHLKKEGETFYYCGVDLPDDVVVEPTPYNPAVQVRQDALSLQLYCMDDYKKCMWYKPADEVK